MNLFKYHSNPKSLHNHNKFIKDVHTWKLENLESTGLIGEDRYYHENNTGVDSLAHDTGLEFIKWDIEGEGQDDFNPPDYYTYDGIVKGSQMLVQLFMEKYFDSKGKVTKIS